MKKRAALLAGIAAALLLAALAPLGGLYEERSLEMSRKRKVIEQSWEQAEKQIAQRAESISGLVETAKNLPGFDAGEAGRLAGAVAKLGAAGSPEATIEANDQISAALAKLIKSLSDGTKAPNAENLARLQDELATIEHRVSVARRQYNQAVQEYNTYIQICPNNVIASMEGFAREEAYFRTSEEERQAQPAVNFVTAPVENAQ
jgi:LemA protein